MRQVRKECGFGCVICGEAFNYEHIVDYSVLQSHAPAQMALLCGSHHRQVTGKMLSKQTVLEHRQDPVGLRNNFSHLGVDYKSGDPIVVVFGKVTVQDPSGSIYAQRLDVELILVHLGGFMGLSCKFDGSAPKIEREIGA